MPFSCLTERHYSMDVALQHGADCTASLKNLIGVSIPTINEGQASFEYVASRSFHEGHEAEDAADCDAGREPPAPNRSRAVLLTENLGARLGVSRVPEVFEISTGLYYNRIASRNRNCLLRRLDSELIRNAILS